MNRIGFIALAAVLASLPVQAQVLVAPTTLVLSPQNRFGTYMVTNRTDVAQEVTVDFRFGFPASDSLGNLFMQYQDSAAAARYSMAGWAKAYPRAFILPPGQQQVVRLTVKPPAGIDPGTYWSRIVTTSTPQTPPPDTAANGVATRLVFRLEQVTTVMYRHGEATTGVALEELRTRPGSAGAVHVFANLRRQGNSPFLGTATLRILDANGAVVLEVPESLALYFDQVKRFDVPAGALQHGSYVAEVGVIAQRSDIPRRDLLRAPPVSARARFAIPVK
jgi:P pilus assembly chaperone PapD